MSLVVCPVGELPPWQMRTVMADGTLSHLISSDEPGTYELTRRAEILRCPWHSYEYDVVTGRCLTDPKLRLRTYPVRIEAGNLVVDV